MNVNWKRIKAITAAAVVVIFAPIVAYSAAPQFPALGSSVFPMTFHVTGALTATVTNAIKFNAPFDLRLLYGNVMVQAKSGTFDGGGAQGVQKSIVNVNNNGVLAMTMDLVQPAAGVVQEATNVTAQLNVTKDNPIAVDIVLFGASPSITHTVVTLWMQRRS